MNVLVCSTCGVVYSDDKSTVCPTCRNDLLVYEYLVKNCNTCKYRETPFYFNPCRHCGDGYTNWKYSEGVLKWRDIDAK